MRPRLAPLALLLLVVSAPAASALSFLEDFESFGLGGFNPELKPDQDWYNYAETADIGQVSSTDPISGSQSFRLESDAGSSNAATFTMAGATQLTNLTFTLKGATQSEGGSRQFVQIQSQAPRRTMVEFYVFCTDSNEPGACEFRVRWEQVDSKGQVLINTTLGQDTFTVTVLPDWTTGTFQLLVNGVDDGVFPFLELPSNIGRLRIAQDTSAYPLNATFDDWFIDGAVEAPEAPERDVAQFLKDYAADIHFTTPTSLFLFGLWLFAVLVGAVLLASIAVGKDNTIAPPVAFFAVLVALWLVQMEFWPDWIGIALIILTSALISLVIRQLLMGIKDASTNAGVVAGSLGYFIIVSTLLGFSGYASETVEIPGSILGTPEDVEAQTNETADKQSWTGAITECAIGIVQTIATLGSVQADCSRETVSTTWANITNFASTIFNFARTAFSFLFQLLTFQLPIPTIFNVMIVLPPAAALATVGFGFITRSGS